MQKNVRIQEDYLYIPVYSGGEQERVRFFVQKDDGAEEKVFEFLVPVNRKRQEGYNWDYVAELPVRDYKGSVMRIEGAIPECFEVAIENSEKKWQHTCERPLIHFTANRGWVNDPNGLVYQNGVYHLYFQHNPFDLAWNNMSWGHAVSTDLLHWTQKDSVMFPDADGTVFSGCAVVNERGCLDLPEDALLFCYTAAGGSNEWSAGKAFTQKFAYSTDGGETVHKMEHPYLDTLYVENRDPKIFWHEESQAYIMVLWLRGYRIGIFRSSDLAEWELSQEFYLEQGWECPDLFQLENEAGEKQWFLISAGGHYTPGEFDGYQFRSNGERHKMYLTKVPYAAQSYSGTLDRTVLVPWLRLENDGRMFTGSFGIPVELSYGIKEGWTRIIQKPVREYYEALRLADSSQIEETADEIIYHMDDKNKVIDCTVTVDPYASGRYTFGIKGSVVEYDPCCGDIWVDNKGHQAGIEFSKIEFIVDDNILEIIFDNGIAMGTFKIKKSALTFSLQKDKILTYQFCEMN